ncbi:hypothetical protein JIX56_45195 [Streptomyces sp. CA-210063]|uniref:hypothetical protein n=1 Tax=Streptomyces sp. CA-210063 TaxID=2801029 RepID=UPI00214AA8DA|nr:hypothetical protein [Streptomyces sp. CA-210063]UUU36445.1 hypothetical protein JIX56_45195 [Streptomyces sp. CA-210063]
MKARVITSLALPAALATAGLLGTAEAAYAAIGPDTLTASATYGYQGQPIDGEASLTPGSGIPCTPIGNVTITDYGYCCTPIGNVTITDYGYCRDEHEHGRDHYEHEGDHHEHGDDHHYEDQSQHS